MNKINIRAEYKEERKQKKFVSSHYSEVCLIHREAGGWRCVSGLMLFIAFVAELLSCVRLFVIPRAVARQVSWFMGFPRQEY